MKNRDIVADHIEGEKPVLQVHAKLLMTHLDGRQI
jgi:hypothetical protein